MIPETTIVDTVKLSDGDRTVEFRKIVTPNGERLVIASDGANTRLDALALESLTWQDDAFFADLVGKPHEEGTDAADAGRKLQIGNEYTVIELRPLKTTAGTRLELRSPKLGYERRVSPAEFAAVADKRPDFFSELLRTPFGPETDHHGIH